jgi:hypothetical protein
LLNNPYLALLTGGCLLRLNLHSARIQCLVFAVFSELLLEMFTFIFVETYQLGFPFDAVVRNEVTGKTCIKCPAFLTLTAITELRITKINTYLFI